MPAGMLRKLVLAQALVTFAVIAGLVALHFLLPLAPDRLVDALFVAGLAIALAVLPGSVGVIAGGIDRIHREREASHLGTVQALAAAVDASDDDTAEHSEAVCGLVRTVGVELGLDGGRLRELELVAALHDVGKIGIRKSILHKPGPLTEDEWAVMREHSEIGARILAEVRGCEASGARSGTSTSTGTARATRTASRGTAFPSTRASSWRATPTTP